MNLDLVSDNIVVFEKGTATWPLLREAFQQLMNYSLIGHRLNGAVVCGNGNNTDPELCIRWFVY